MRSKRQSFHIWKYSLLSPHTRWTIENTLYRNGFIGKARP